MVKHLEKVLFRLLICVFVPVVLYSQGYIKTNEEVYKELTRQVLDSFLVSIDVSRDDTITLNYPNDDKTRFINDFIIDYLKNKKEYNLRIYTDRNFEGKILEYFINRLALSYSKPFREKLLSEKKFVRNIYLEFSFKFIKNYNVVDYKTISATLTDTVKHKHIKYIENEMIPLTITKLPNDKTLEKYILPVVTITTVSVIVYLFFIIRK